jgi:DNA-binding GntR family transcriptional regulator
MFVSRVHAPVRQQTTANLRQAIIEGRFKPGERLIERELIRLTGVSRTSIREALRQLETEGLVRVIPNKGSIVASVSPEEARDIYQVRQVLEGLACRLFAETANSSQISSLTAAVRLLEEAIQKKDSRMLIRAKDSFYEILLAGCGNKMVCSLIRSLHARITYLRTMSLSQPSRPLKSLKEIKLILKAIERHDPDGAWNASVEHVHKAQAVAAQVLQGLQKKGVHTFDTGPEPPSGVDTTR